MSSAPDATLAVPHYVYRCYADATLLYVGVARDVEARMFHHLHPCNIGKQPNGSLRRHMTHHEAVRYETKVEARAAERAAITAEGPLLNRQHNPSRFRKVAGGTYEAVAPVHPITAHAFELEQVAS
jgi:hypothetical protein